MLYPNRAEQTRRRPAPTAGVLFVLFCLNHSCLKLSPLFLKNNSNNNNTASPKKQNAQTCFKKKKKKERGARRFRLPRFLGNVSRGGFESHRQKKVKLLHPNSGRVVGGDVTLWNSSRLLRQLREFAHVRQQASGESSSQSTAARTPLRQHPCMYGGDV